MERNLEKNEGVIRKKIMTKMKTGKRRSMLPGSVHARKPRRNKSMLSTKIRRKRGPLFLLVMMLI